ncbi:protein ACCELERATED CELL DEATH 6-like isoform X2 [Quercus lobata]|uniref:protein ACCELERATED CELL DEATH 6-like isoform X2 n=1 Tax=Quercus lobata TaxID=97700 RepID=UPI0012491D06|nr:protein ACCELERATED CELL DEATH 6-like isoform X2 [Quercus lobata]
METRFASSAAVSEVLNIDNYLVWSVQVRTYLMAQDLWEIVEAKDGRPKPENDEAASKAWTRKNAMALHVIQISSGPRICLLISLITSAKDAWDTLAAICRIPKSIYYASDEESYMTWTIRMKRYFMNNNLWEIVEATTEPPMPEGDEIAFKAWSQKNALALFLIRESCGSNIFPRIGNISEAKKAWDTLAEEFSCYNYTDSYSGSENSDSENNDLENGGLSLEQYKNFEELVSKGKWYAVRQFVNDHNEAVNIRLSDTGGTALHAAVLAGRMNIVKEFIELMHEESLEIQDYERLTVLGCSVVVGNIEMAKCIINKNKKLLSIGNGRHQFIPAVLAITNNSIAMARSLYDDTPPEDLRPEKGFDGATFVTRCIYTGAFDLALHLLNRTPTLATALDTNGESPLLALACMSYAYPSGNRLIFWKQWIYQNRLSNLLKPLGIKQICELKLLHLQSYALLRLVCQQLQDLSKEQKENVRAAILRAVKNGIFEFVTVIQRERPGLLKTLETSSSRSILKSAVQHRQNKVFSVLYGLHTKNKKLSTELDREGNSILHVAAILDSSTALKNVPGAALQMQKELQWFKEMQNIVDPLMLDTMNKKGQKPQELFTESHKDMVKAGEKWMQKTATSCTVVGALIVTIMFAAIITVPGGNNQSIGWPMFLNKKLFMLFIICDALSLLSSSTSVLMFLGILTSRYAEEDFLESLPRKMIIGLSTLIFSIATMMITFCASLFIILHGKSWVVIPIICLASVPVTLFTFTQFRLLIDMFNSTYGSGIFDRNVDSW